MKFVKFKELTKSKIKDEDFLWRYVDLHKLIDLAQSLELHFTRTDKFSDPFEGVTYKLIAERYLASKSNLSNPKFDKEVRDAHNKTNEIKLQTYAKESLKKQRTQFINCWLKSTRESVAMWNLYSNRNSVVIRANARKLIDYFKTNLKLQTHFPSRYEFICGSVSYHKLNPFNPYEKKTLPKYSSFKKEEAYDFEKEFRFLIATPLSECESTPDFIRLPLTKNFINLIDIVCHPEMEPWKFQNIIGLCDRLGLPKPTNSGIEMRLK